jgi:hypothetical protein
MMNEKFKRTQKEVVEAYFNLLSQSFIEGTEKREIAFYYIEWQNKLFCSREYWSCSHHFCVIFVDPKNSVNRTITI